MKQLFKTLAMLFFVCVLFTNKLNAQMTLEHTFEGGASYTLFGNYYYTLSDYSDEGPVTITFYDDDYNLYKQTTILLQQGYESDDVVPISPEIICTNYHKYSEEVGYYIYTMIFCDIDGNIIKKIDYVDICEIELVPNSKNIFLLSYAKDGTFYTEVYSVDGYDLNEKIIASSFSHAYPNPAKSTISLPYNLNKGEQAEMLIYDVNGRMIDKKRIDSTFNKILLNVESYTPGVYFYSVNGVSQKFVVK